VTAHRRHELPGGAGWIISAMESFSSLPSRRQSLDQSRASPILGRITVSLATMSPLGWTAIVCAGDERGGS
jgi:hypothetical protein